MSAAVYSGMPESFRAWAAQLKELQLFKEAARLESNKWWLRAALPLRGYLLAQSGVDDVYRYMDTPWGSLPDGLRSSIIVNTKALRREIDGCGWL